MSKNKQEKIVDYLDDIVHKLEAGANHYYSPHGEDVDGWNILLKARDQVKKLREKEEQKLYSEKAKNNKKNDC